MTMSPVPSAILIISYIFFKTPAAFLELSFPHKSPTAFSSRGLLTQYTQEASISEGRSLSVTYIYFMQLAIFTILSLLAK